MFCALCAVVTM